MRAVVTDLMGSRARDEATIGARIARTDGLVVTVEQGPVGVLEARETGLVFGEHERLEEPGHVGAMPFGGTDVRHRLHRLILRAERSRQFLGESANPGVLVCEIDLGRLVAGFPVGVRVLS